VSWTERRARPVTALDEEEGQHHLSAVARCCDHLGLLVDAAVALGENLRGPETAVLGRLNTTHGQRHHARTSLACGASGGGAGAPESHCRGPAAGGKTDSKPHENSPYKMSGWYFQSW
jgi:hypothetical protein